MSKAGRAGVAFLMMLAGCGDGGETGQRLAKSANALSIDCRSDGNAPLRPVCTGEWRGTDEAGRRILVIRKADGGFRRLLVGQDGRVGQADGAEPMRLVGEEQGAIRVAIGPDEFRLTRAQLGSPQ